MKATLLSILLLLVVSCERTGYELNPDSPMWLMNRIEKAELQLITDPDSEISVSAWIRYEYSDHYYFENVNLVSSAWPLVYRADGTEFKSNESGYQNYQSGKCCRHFIWKGPLYPDTIN